MIIKKFLFIILLFFLFFPYGKLLAQTSGQVITISPLIFDLSVHPGEILKNTLRLYNPGQQTLKVVMSVEDFKAVGEEGSVEITQLEPEIEKIYSLTKWVEIKPSQFEISPREEKFVEFTINVPIEAEPGGKYGALIANVGKIDTLEAGTGAMILQKVASLLLVSVSGPVEEKLLVREFKGPTFQEYGPINFSLRLENLGTVHLRPRGTVAITDWRNKKVADLIIPQQVVMPKGRRIINIKWDKKNILGRFTATVVGSYGSTNEPFTAVWTFWVWPWKLSLAIFIAAILIIYFFYRTRKRWLAALRILFKGESTLN
ncbi:MAG: hypothetical protein ACK413_00630 [Patescibacteria group bacterium]